MTEGHEWNWYRLTFYTKAGKFLGATYARAHTEAEAREQRPTHVWQTAEMKVEKR